jgi:diaminohydroxyphosphoribosylaminopyrimidine deaminase/5-amino-6-(5-phosphoribosylamino)uracil reductase
MLDADHAWNRLLGVRNAADAARAGLVHDGDWRWSEPATAEATTLAQRYTPLCVEDTPCAFAQLGQSADGFIAPHTRHAVYVTGEEDRLHLHRLRALADAVVVGARTAVVDDPRLTVRACAGTDPVRVVIDRSGRVPRDRTMFTDGRAPTLVVADRRTPPPTDGVELLRLPGTGALDPSALLAALAERGLARVLIEGGGVTVSRFLESGALHRLFVTTTPDRLGGGVPGVSTTALGAPTRQFPLGRDLCSEYVRPAYASAGTASKSSCPTSTRSAPAAHSSSLRAR